VGDTTNLAVTHLVLCHLSRYNYLEIYINLELRMKLSFMPREVEQNMVRGVCDRPGAAGN
jgi:hypothetical protein